MNLTVDLFDEVLTIRPLFLDNWEFYSSTKCTQGDTQIAHYQKGKKQTATLNTGQLTTVSKNLSTFLFHDDILIFCI